jgi:hypothetical protein
MTNYLTLNIELSLIVGFTSKLAPKNPPISDILLVKVTVVILIFALIMLI